MTARLKNLFRLFREAIFGMALIRSQHDFLMRAEWARLLTETKNPLNRYGAKYFSQSDEDGITLEIIRRIGITAGRFVEFGVGDGLENNTLILLASGWRGIWIGGEDLAFELADTPRLVFLKRWVSAENVTAILAGGLATLGSPEIDLLSVDLDGNDYHLIAQLLGAGVRPKIVIVEYNAKFPPPIRWVMPYDPAHRWDQTDYFGASLAAYCELFARFSYELVCCNAATGLNAFFVRNEYFMPIFDDVPVEIDDIFIGCRYQLPARWGHPPSRKTIEAMIKREDV
jgi:hypothetical protein